MKSKRVYRRLINIKPALSWPNPVCIRDSHLPPDECPPAIGWPAAYRRQHQHYPLGRQLNHLAAGQSTRAISHHSQAGVLLTVWRSAALFCHALACLFAAASADPWRFSTRIRHRPACCYGDGKCSNNRLVLIDPIAAATVSYCSIQSTQTD